MAAYTRLNPEDVQEILDIYGIKDFKTVEPLSLGISNSNYRIDLHSGESIILKVSNDKGVDDLREEQVILHALSDFPFSLTPYKTLEGHGVYEWRQLYGAIFPFVSGSKPMGAPEELSLLGEALGRMHVYSQSLSLEKTQLRCHSKVGYDLGSVLTYCEQPDALEEFKSACERLLSESDVELWKKSDLAQGLIHGDLYLDNTLFEDGKISALLDFEQSGIGRFLQDIGISISGSCLDKEGISLDKIDAFITGYEKARVLDPIEKRLLNFSVTLGLLDISLWRIKRFTEGDLDPSRKESYKELLALAESFVSRTSL